MQAHPKKQWLLSKTTCFNLRKSNKKAFILQGRRLISVVPPCLSRNKKRAAMLKNRLGRDNGRNPLLAVNRFLVANRACHKLWPAGEFNPGAALPTCSASTLPAFTTHPGSLADGLILLLWLFTIKPNSQLELQLTRLTLEWTQRDSNPRPSQCH